MLFEKWNFVTNPVHQEVLEDCCLHHQQPEIKNHFIRKKYKVTATMPFQGIMNIVMYSIMHIYLLELHV